MKLGILADIHEDVASLRLALARLKEHVDSVVVLGDLFQRGEHLLETATLLAEAGAVGVWGNHELGLYVEGCDALKERYAGPFRTFLHTLQPRLEQGGCLFTHGLPQWDPTDGGMYYLGDRPETLAGRTGCFLASSCRVSFVGHFHRWLLATPEGIMPWQGEDPIYLASEQRYLVVVAAVCDGWCAVYDTDSGCLLPIPLRR